MWEVGCGMLNGKRLVTAEAEKSQRKMEISSNYGDIG